MILKFFFSMKNSVKAYPLSLVPFGKIFSTPPKRRHRIAFFMYSLPCMDGARDFARSSKIFLHGLFFANFLHIVTSSWVIARLASLLSCIMLLAIRTVLRNVISIVKWTLRWRYKGYMTQLNWEIILNSYLKHTWKFRLCIHPVFPGDIGSSRQLVLDLQVCTSPLDRYRKLHPRFAVTDRPELFPAFLV